MTEVDVDNTEIQSSTNSPADNGQETTSVVWKADESTWHICDDGTLRSSRQIYTITDWMLVAVNGSDASESVYSDKWVSWVRSVLYGETIAYGGRYEDDGVVSIVDEDGDVVTVQIALD